MSISRFSFWVIPFILLATYVIYFKVSHLEEVPLTGRKQVVELSREEELTLGSQVYRQFLADEMVLSGETPEARMVNKVGDLIARASSDIDPGFDWEFSVFQSEFPQAFALPGGLVAVSTGLLPVTQNSDGLAVVMSHEIAHALARHGAERLASHKMTLARAWAPGFTVEQLEPGERRKIIAMLGIGNEEGGLNPYSAEHEEEAGRMSMLLLARACIDPGEAIRFWSRLAGPGNVAQTGWLSTHPAEQSRADTLGQWLPEAMEVRKAFCET